MSNYAQHVSKSKKAKAVREDAPQSAPADARQTKNAAGGFTFEVDCWKQLTRFLILGAEGGTYHVGERDLVKGSTKALEACLAVDAAATIEEIAKISESGRAPKNDPAIFALAFCAAHKDLVVRRLALAALPRICRIGTHLFQFVEQVQQLRGWSKALQRAVAAWYVGRDAKSLAYQLVKYQQRNGMSHRDVMRLAHPKSPNADIQALLRWTVAAGSLDERSVTRKHSGASVTYGAVSRDALPPLIGAFESMRNAETKSDLGAVQSLIREHRMTHEMVPSEFLGKPEIWDALLGSMPMHALVRNIGRMTANGLLADGSDASKRVIEQLSSIDAIKKSRLHPFAVLLALRTYSAGHGEKGKLAWKPVKAIEKALDDTFYAAFDAIEPTYKRIMLALDVSGSMGGSRIAGSTVTAREAVAVMAMVTARREPNYELVGFTAASGGYGGQWGGGNSGLSRVNITPKTSLKAACDVMAAMPMGGTDCALPMLHAMKTAAKFDAFAVYTDNETWAGTTHPHVALKQYRQQTSIPAKLVVVATEASSRTIADPTDAGMLDVVGFDAAAPAVISDFIRD